MFLIDVEDSEDVGAASLPTQPPPPSSAAYDPSSMPPSGYTGVQIPPGAHAPANTPAEVPHSAGRGRAEWVPAFLLCNAPSLSALPSGGGAALLILSAPHDKAFTSHWHPQSNNNINFFLLKF